MKPSLLFKVFETLNARGVQLSSSDLLKNYIFSVANANDLHEYLLNDMEHQWSEISDILQGSHIADFLRTFWNASHKAVRKNQLYKAIREGIRTPEQAFSLLVSMREKAHIYMALQNESDEFWRGKKEITEPLAILNVFDAGQTTSLLMGGIFGTF